MNLKCLCGERILDISDCQSYKGHIISDKEYFDFLDFADEMIESSHSDRESLAMTFRMGIGKYIKIRTVFQCYNCGRILLEDGEGNYKFFLPEGHSDCKLLDFEAGNKIETMSPKG